MKVLVTGGAGFIGSHLARATLARGDDVAIIDDLSSGTQQRLERLPSGARFLRASILDRPALDEAVAGRDVVFHLAAIASVQRSIADPVAVEQVNVGGTIEVMQAAARHGVRRVVFASSSAVYGVPGSLPCRETQEPRPISPYGVSKASGEQYVRVLGELHGVETVALRFFNVYGGDQDPDSEYAAVIPRFVTALVEGRRPTIFGSGLASRDFIHVDDVVAANLLAASSPGPSGIACNIAGGVERTLLDLLEAISASTGRPADPIFAAPRAGDIERSLADISLARDAIGFTVDVDFPTGMDRTVAWYAAQAGSRVDP